MAGANPKYDWSNIATEYQHGYVEFNIETNMRKHTFPTLQKLSEKYGCALETIKAKSAAEQWSLKRDLFRTKIRAKLEDKKVSELFNESAKFDAKNLHKINQIHQLLDSYFAQYSMLVDPDDNSIIMGEDSPTINIKELESIIRVIRESHTVVRSIFGEPLNNENMMQEINELNSNDHKGDSKARKAKIKSLSNKLSAKEKLRYELLEKKKQLEELLQSKDDSLKE